MNRTDLSEKQWRQLESHLPGDPHRGHAYVDHRRVLNGILWRLKTGAPWRDVPARYGPWQTCYDRFVRWSRDGTWQRSVVAASESRCRWPYRLGWGSTGFHAYQGPPQRHRRPQNRCQKRKKEGRERRMAGAFAWRTDQQDPFVCRWKCALCRW